MPLSLFTPSGVLSPDFRQFELDDFGNTIKFGAYEAAADFILYEVDPDYRRRINTKRRMEEKGFGPALRRLRLQRKLSRSDFPGVSEKTISRIERGEVKKLHEKTLKAICVTVGVRPDEIENY